MVSQSREAAYCSFWLDLVQFFFDYEKKFYPDRAAHGRGISANASLQRYRER